MSEFSSVQNFLNRPTVRKSLISTKCKHQRYEEHQGQRRDKDIGHTPLMTTSSRSGGICLTQAPASDMNPFTQRIREGRDQEGRNVNKHNAFEANTVSTF